MMDMLPFLRVTGTTPEEQIASIVSYLTQFKETLEFVLMNISTENLSPDLVNMLNELGAGIEQSNADREDEVAQISTNALTIPDVINSDMFKDAIATEQLKELSLNVDFETGHLEYNISNEEVNNG